MRTLKALVGNITFLDPQIDGQHVAIVELDKCQEWDVIEDDEAIEGLLAHGEAYLIPELYSGEIRYL